MDTSADRAWLATTRELVRIPGTASTREEGGTSVSNPLSKPLLLQLQKGGKGDSAAAAGDGASDGLPAVARWRRPLVSCWLAG